MANSTKDWSALIAAKRSSNLEKIPPTWKLSSAVLKTIHENATINVTEVPKACGILTDFELELTEKYDASELTRMLREGTVKAEDVVTAFCKRAAIAHQLTNCLTEIMFDSAIARARELDDYFKTEGKPVGPLHGLPVSLKDSFNVKGFDTTIGYVSFLERPPAAHNSALVDILLQLGAVPHVKTNLPQTMMTADSENRVFGRTLNPNKLCLTAGGSTGGEGALVKLHGSVLGIGTDIAGSVRIPALCNGIMGFKPTSRRIPFAGKQPPGRLGSPSQILPVIGCKGYSVRDFQLFMKTVIEADPWKLDPGVIPVPWREVAPAKPVLKLGFITEDRAHRPLHPPQLRMMTCLTNMLEKAGHQLVPLEDQVPGLYETSLLAWKYFLLDPKQTVLNILQEGNESFIKSVLGTAYPELKDWVPSLDELWDMNLRRAAIMKAYHDLVVEHDLDAILLPTHQSTAVPHDTYGLVPYTVLANLLDYPCIALPFQRASKADDSEFVRPEVNYHSTYDADVVEGAPCGFQIMGLPMKDEELLKITEAIFPHIQAWL